MKIIVIFVIVTICSILIHELGHLLASLFDKDVSLQVFTLGVGPVIFSKVIKGVRCDIRLLPLGGACSFEGLAYKGKGLFTHLLIALAGIIANLLASLVAIDLIAQYPVTEPYVVVQSVGEHINGIVQGDKIISIEQHEVNLDNLPLILYEPQDWDIEVLNKDNNLKQVHLSKEMYIEAESGYVLDMKLDGLSAAHLKECSVGAIFRYIKNHSISDSFCRLTILTAISLDHLSLCFIIYFAFFNVMSFVGNILPLYSLDGGYAMVILVTFLKGRTMTPKEERRYILISQVSVRITIACIFLYLLL